MFSYIFQASRPRFRTFCEFIVKFKLLPSGTCVLEGCYSRRWVGRPFSTDGREGRSKTTKGDHASQIRHELVDATVSTSAIQIVNGIKPSELKKLQCSDAIKEIAKLKNIDDYVTIIVFDFETTGLSTETDRIIEICLYDIDGGEDCTFHELVNPGFSVPNHRFHGIKSRQVNRPDVRRMEELLPNLLQFVESRRKSGGYILWVAHNARRFDVRFLINEFKRCSIEVPSNWLFLDSLPLARELLKSGGSKIPSGFSLQELRKFYGIPLIGSAHTAKSDVNSLSEILKRLTTDLNLETYDLVNRSFIALDVIKPKKTKNSS